VAIGANAEATNARAVAVGVNSDAIFDSSMAFGFGAQAKATNTIVIGRDAGSTNGTFGSGSITMGFNANGGTSNIGQNSVAIGTDVNAVGNRATAIGYDHSNTQGDSVTFGWGDATFRLAESATSYANGTGAFVFGGTTETNSSVSADFQSTTRVPKMPVLTTVQKEALTDTAGLVVFDSDTGALEYNDGSDWNSTGASVYLTSELTGEASSTIGQFTKASDASSTANPSAKALTSSGSPGMNNGGTMGYLVPESGLSIDQVTIKFAGAAVGTGTVGTPTVRVRFFRQNYSTRTQIGSDLDITISTTGVGIFNNTSGNAFQSVTDSSVSIAVSQGDLIGWEFVNQSGTNDGINALSRISLMVKLA